MRGTWASPSEFAHRHGDALGYYESRFLRIEEEALGLEYVL